MSETEINFELRVLLDVRADFQAKFISVANLKNWAYSSPESVSDESFQVVVDVLDTALCRRERQCFFLYREAAFFFVALFIQDAPQSDKAYATLKRLLQNSTGPVHRAIAESLGSLDIPFPSPKVVFPELTPIPCIGFSEFVERENLDIAEIRFHGRSGVFPVRSQDDVLVMKFSRDGTDLLELAGETVWMDHLKSDTYHFPVRFDIPEPVFVHGKAVFEMRGLPECALPPSVRDREKIFAIAFRAHREYFSYPNEPDENEALLSGNLPALMHRNAFLLGRLMSYGLVHTAPIPLFHNRIQQGRRDDQGLYDWPQAGRLDRWLESCSYPNIGCTGTRDFEHFETVASSRRTPYWHIGTHILSLLLVVGSCFRNRQKDLSGSDREGGPVDARGLFDPALLQAMVRGAFEGYFHGFVGKEYDDEYPFNLERLTARMVEEMGVDTHMEEILRSHDQERMSDDLFAECLRGHGLSKKEILAHQRGKEDIVLFTGPHLGGFNEGISLMELIEATASISAVCIVGKFLNS